MYGVAVTRELEAFHYLVGVDEGDWGHEEQPHRHRYKVEALISGEELDSFGFLVDITVLQRAMEELMNYFKGKTLNMLPEFSGINPSVEHFCRVWCRMLKDALDTQRLASITVRIWESEIAWATYKETL